MLSATARTALGHAPQSHVPPTHVSQVHMPQMQGANFLNLLIVDEDRAVRDASREVAHSLGFSAHVAESADQVYRMIESNGIDAVLLDLRLPGADGLEVLRNVKRNRPDAVVVLTGCGTVQSAVQAMKNGAYDFVTKPFSMEELRQLLAGVAGHLRVKTESRLRHESIKSRQGFANIVGHAPEMEKLYRIIAKAGQSTHPVLIFGRERHGQRDGGEGDSLFGAATQ